jgi:hypothetical protein
MPNQTQSVARSATPVTTADHNDAVIRVYDQAGNVTETHEQPGNFKEP